MLLCHGNQLRTHLGTLAVALSGLHAIDLALHRCKLRKGHFVEVVQTRHVRSPFTDQSLCII
jgi:hypothetical protein